MLKSHNRVSLRTLILLLVLLNSLLCRGQIPLVVDVLGQTYKMDPAQFEYRLLIAASTGDTSLIKGLIRVGVDIDIQSDMGATPLYLAVTYNKPYAAMLLLNLGADPDFPTNLGETPLHAAIKSQNLIIAELLIRNGAAVNIKDINGAVPLHYAALLGYYYETDMLLYYDADPESRAKDGTTPLMAAVMSGSYDITDILLGEGANVNSRDESGYTPLLLAAQNGDTLITEMLHLYGASLYSIADDRYNAAAVAIKEGHNEYFEYLFTKGNLWSDPKGLSLWAVAEQYRRKEMVPLLQKYKIHKSPAEALSNISAGISIFATSNQTFAGASLSTRKEITGTGVIAGIDFKPLDSRVIIKDENDNLTQFIDRRNIVYAGIFKGLVISENNLNAEWLLTFTGKMAYMFGNKYPGSGLRPEHKFAFIPSISLSLEIPGFTFSIAGEYLKTEVYKSGPAWLRAGIAYNYRIDNVRSKGKIIRWY